jgi:microcystin-dependent protein
MSRPKFVQARKTSLVIGIASTETGEIRLKQLVDLYGNELSMSDFGDVMYLTIAPDTNNEEIISATDFTVNSDGSVTINTGITRGLDGATPYTEVSGAANDHAPGTIVVASNNPQMYEAILDYIEEIALAGVGNATTTTAGVVEEATEAEIDADTAAGATGRRLAVNPSTLATSKYGTRLPSADGKQLLDTVTGMIFDFAGPTLPTGFLACDGVAYNNDDYTDLVAVLLGYYGYGDYNEFTADSGTDFLTDTDHGLENGDIVLLSSVDDDLPDGLAANTIYYVVNKTTNTFQLSLTSGGSAVDFSDNGSGTLYYHTQFKVPDLRGSVTIGKGQKTQTITFHSDDIVVQQLAANAIETRGDNETVEFSAAHGLSSGDTIVFVNSFGNIVAGTVYYVYVDSSTLIKLHTTRRSAINDTSPVDLGYTDSYSYAAYKLPEPYTVENGVLPDHFVTGAKVSLTTAGTLPTGLTATDYYFIRLSDTTFQLARTSRDAVTDSEAQAISAAGSGQHTLTLTISSNRTLAEEGGEEEHILADDELPASVYVSPRQKELTDVTASSTRDTIDASYGDWGTDGAHNNMQPFVSVYKIIKT